MDVVVAAIGHSAITRRDVVREFGLEHLLEYGALPEQPPSAPELVQARTRLIDQKLLAAQISSFPADERRLRQSALRQIAGLRTKFQTTEEFQSALLSLGITEPELIARLEQDQRILLVIHSRMAPAAAVTEHEIEQYYQRTFLPRFSRLNGGAPPPLAAVNIEIRKILVQQKINKLLDQWVNELSEKQRVRIIAGD